MALLAITAALSASIALRYLAVAAGMYALLWRRGAPRLPRVLRLNTRAPSRAGVAHELRASLVSSPIYAFPAAVALVAFQHGQGRMYADWGRYGRWWLPLSAAIYLMDPQGRFVKPLNETDTPAGLAGQIRAAMGA